MRLFIALTLLFGSLLQANTKKELDFYLFANSSEKQIELKWFTKKYSSQYTYKIYRSSDKKKPELLTIVKPMDFKLLKKNGYSDDYIFMIYPLKDTKSIADKIQVAKIDDNVQGFRILKFMRDKSFAKNLGHYFVDIGVDKESVYSYTVQVFLKDKMLFQRSILGHTYKQKSKDDFMWTRAKVTPKGVALSWDVQDEFSYFNVYRKKSTEKEYKKLNEDPLFITKKYAQRAKSLYLDTSLKEGESVSYYIRKIDMFSNEGLPSKEFKVTLKMKKEIPQEVTNLFVLNKDTKIQLRWAKSYNVEGYNVYKSTIYEGNFVKVNKELLTKEVFFDRDFEAGKKYFYYVTAVNKNGESNPSKTMLAYVRDVIRPQTPLSLSAKVEVGKVKLSWEKVSDKNLAGYRVYVSMDEDAKQWSLINKELVKENSFEHSREKTFSRFVYFYKVTSVDSSFNESFASNIVKIKLPDVTPPKEPFISSFKIYTNKIKLEWSEVKSYDMKGYNVYRKNGEKYEKLNNTPLKVRVFTDIAPNNGENTYVVTSVDTSNNESKKTKFKTLKLKDIIPVKISDFKLEKTKNGIKASFTCKDKDYIGFKLFRSSGAVLNYFNVSNFQDTYSYEDTKLTKNTTYFYMIKAYDTSGNIAESNIVEIKY